MGSLQKKEVEVSCKLKEMHVLQGHSGSVYNVTEGSGFHSEKSCYLSTSCLSLDMCKQSNGSLQGLGPSKELSLKASQTLNAKQLMQLSFFNAKLDQNALLDSCLEKFSSLDVSLVDSKDDDVSVDMRPLNPWAREYHRSGDRHLFWQTRSLSLDMCKQSTAVLQGLGPSKELCLKASQTLNPKQLMRLPSFKAKVDQNAPLDSCEEKFSSLDVSLVNSQNNVVSVNMRPLNPWAGEYNRVGDQNLSSKQESMPSFLESVRKQELSSNLTVSEPILFTNISGTSNLLNLLNYFPHKAPVVCSRKKLLILDINGILADIVYPPPKAYKADTKIAGRAVFTRPFCSDFLNFCLERFNVAIWSSRSRKIIDRLLNYLMGDMKHKLIFCWDLSHCTASNFRTLENKHKTLVFKELRKVWESYDADLPWEKGFFNESNTFLLDDTPYKALLNPAHTAIFPYSYGFNDIADNAIGPGGNIRAYLEDLAAADNVQRYIEKHPFGQSAITERSLSWHFYDKVIKEQSAVPAVG